MWSAMVFLLVDLLYHVIVPLAPRLCHTHILVQSLQYFFFEVWASSFALGRVSYLANTVANRVFISFLAHETHTVF